MPRCCSILISTVSYPFTADVFSDTAPVVTSVLDGYNVCIFAYGQTGTGTPPHFASRGGGKEGEITLDESHSDVKTISELCFPSIGVQQWVQCGRRQNVHHGRCPGEQRGEFPSTGGALSGGSGTRKSHGIQVCHPYAIMPSVAYASCHCVTQCRPMMTPGTCPVRVVPGSL